MSFPISLISQPGQQQMAGIQRVVINQPGLRPGQPGAQITVPLSTLQVFYCLQLVLLLQNQILFLLVQALQAGQGIPTGQPGHLLVKTETGQYQVKIIKMLTNILQKKFKPIFLR